MAPSPIPIPIPFVDLEGPLTREELAERLANHPDLSPMGGDNDIQEQLIMKFMLRNSDRRVLALFFGPDTYDPAKWVLVNWIPVPTP